MYFDRYDIIEAHYWFCANYHGGQWSELYARLSRLSRIFTPSPLSRGPESENARDIYIKLVRKFNKHRRQNARRKPVAA
jgi:hypothetical protein